MFNCTGNVEVLCSFVFVIERWAAAQLRLESLACPLEKPLEQTGAKEPNWLMGLGRPPLRSWVLKDRVDVNRERERDVLYSASPSRYHGPIRGFPIAGMGKHPGRSKMLLVVVRVCVLCVCVSSRITAGSLLTATCNFAFSRNADSLSIRRDPVVQIPEIARNM